MDDWPATIRAEIPSHSPNTIDSINNKNPMLGGGPAGSFAASVLAREGYEGSPRFRSISTLSYVSICVLCSVGYHVVVILIRSLPLRLSFQFRPSSHAALYSTRPWRVPSSVRRLLPRLH
ncbi:hypothetical protein BC938DRAFT_482786, partial [Jimgerdemannia flammicorona]